MMEDNKDKEEFDNAIKYFQSIINTNNSTNSDKIATTFIGIKTNISGIFKLHIYILFFPFPSSEIVVPYSNRYSNLYIKDICFNVDKNFYLWIYDEMKKLNSIIIMSLESKIFKVISGFGDSLISIDKNSKEKKEWMDLEFEAWFEKKKFNNIFIINIINPYLYIVPFPVKPIIIQTVKKLSNYVAFI
jgi:hypothetical protein